MWYLASKMRVRMDLLDEFQTVNACPCHRPLHSSNNGSDFEDITTFLTSFEVRKTGKVLRSSVERVSTMSGDGKDHGGRRGSQELIEPDQSLPQEPQRPELHRTSSGFSETLDTVAITSDVRNLLQQLSVPSSNNVRRISEDGDSGLDSPVPKDCAYRYPPIPLGKGVVPGVVPLAPAVVVPAVAAVTKVYPPPTEYAVKQKLVMNELQSKILLTERQRSKSQSDLDVKTLYDSGEKRGFSYEKKEKPNSRSWKNKDNLLMPKDSALTYESKSHPQLERSRTLPSQVGKRFQESAIADDDPLESDDKQKKKGFENKNKSFKDRLSKLTRNLSTRTVKHKKRKEKHNKTLTDNLSDSESYENIIPLGRSLKASRRLSRSMDALDGLYDVVGPIASFNKQGHVLKEDFGEYDDPAVYETCAPRFQNRRPSYNPIAVGFLETDGAAQSSDIGSGALLSGHVKHDLAMRTRSNPQKALPAVPREPQMDLKQRPLPAPNMQKGKRPLPPPDATYNLQMAMRVIEDILRTDSTADKTEIVVQTRNFVAKYCDENGGFLEVGSKMAALVIPPYAIDETSGEEYPTLIYIQIEESFHFTERIEGDLIAPDIHCGTSGTKFNSPVILTFKTSVESAANLIVTGLIKQDKSESDWHETSSKDDGKVVSVENGKCTMMLNHFTLYDAAAEPSENSHFGKVKIVAFTSPVLRRDGVFDIRVYLSSSDEELKQCEEREVQDNHAKRLGHFRTSLNLFEDGGDLVIEIARLNEQWCPAESALKETLNLIRLKYEFDNSQEGIRESCVFRIKPAQTYRTRHQEVNHDQSVIFDIVLCQTKRKDYAVKLHVNELPELAQSTPGQRQSYHVTRQKPGWKPHKRSLERLERSLSEQGRWTRLAAWLHLDANVLESLSSPVSGMISMLCSKHVGRDCMASVIRELKDPLDKLGSDCNEARDIVADMLRDMGPSVDGAVVHREAIEDTWPLESLDAECYAINEYRYYGVPRAYATLRSDDVPRLVSVPVYNGASHSGTPNASVAEPGYRSEGARPRTLSSMRDAAEYSESRSAPVAVQDNWPRETEGPREVDLSTDGASLHTLMIPRGIQHRKSSGYATIGIDIDPNRPPLNLPEPPEYHYDVPEIRSPPSGVSETNGPNMVNHMTNDDGTAVQDREDLNQLGSLDSHMLREEPPYVNTQVVEHRKPNAGSYFKGIKNSKVQHPVEDRDNAN